MPYNLIVNLNIMQKYKLPEELKYASTNLFRSFKSVKKKQTNIIFWSNIINKKLLKEIQHAPYQDIYCSQVYEGCQYDSQQPSHRSGLLCHMQQGYNLHTHNPDTKWEHLSHNCRL